MRNKSILINLSLLISLAVTAQGQATAIEETHTSSSGGSSARMVDTRMTTRTFRTTRDLSGASRNSTSRSREDVRTTRTAHGHAKNNHVLNKLSTMGMTSITRIGGMPHSTFSSKIANMGSVQHLVLTAGHDEKHSSKTDSKNSSSDSSKHDDKGNQVAHAGDHHDHSDHNDRKDEKSREKRSSSSHRTHHRSNEDSADAGSGGGNVGSGNQGVGDGSNVSYTATNTIDELNSAVRTLTLHQGTAFVAHEKPVVLKTTHGDVHIAPHTAVYVVSVGKSVGIYDIADRKTNDVRVVTHGNKQIDLKAGEQVLLTDKESKTEDANPAPEIHTSRLKELDGDGNCKIYHAEFHPMHALDHATGFHDLVNSKNKTDRALANHILKTAAIVLNLRASD